MPRLLPASLPLPHHPFGPASEVDSAPLDVLSAAIEVSFPIGGPVPGSVPLEVADEALLLRRVALAF